MPDASTPVQAAGAVLWRPGPTTARHDPSAVVGRGGEAAAGREIAVIHRPRYDDWSFPKGKLDKGEHVLHAVAREVEEETGCVVLLGRRLPTATYMHNGRPKRVDYWSATVVSSTEFTPNEEVDELRWLPVEEAARLLTYERDVDLLREFTAGPAHTWPLIILRHASAGEKKDWHDLDALRPLDARGRHEAVALTSLLALYGQARLISSATARCVQTVLPYALQHGSSVTTDQAFTVGQTSVDQLEDRVKALVSAAEPTIICTHGEIVADLLTLLCRTLGEKVPDNPTLRKAAFWVAHMATAETNTTTITALERHTAP